MTLREAIYALRTIIKENNIDTDIRDPFLVNRINALREKSIFNYYSATNHFNPNWVQNIGVQETSNVNSADDTLIQRTSTVLSKIEVKGTVELGKLDILNLRTGAKHQKINHISMDRLFNMIRLNDEMLLNKYVYFRLGKNVYVYPTIKYVSYSAILQNPLEGVTTDQLVDMGGNVISEQGIKRNLTIDDEYPLEGKLVDEVLVSILRIDYNVNVQSVKDYFPDGISEKDLRR